MYPKVTTVEWTHKSDYHIAGFVSDSHEMNAWFGNNAQWIMTETNVESLEAKSSNPEKITIFMEGYFCRIRSARVRPSI